ncbi:hypothetical protein B0H11DRAFT_2057867 [Mycena galericulata]|nr:hypothetical protein B0H11DRAFT_2057867 [Mycena galericulata]
MGHDRLARWRRRWAYSLTWLGLGTVAMGGWTCWMDRIFAVSHGPDSVVGCHQTGRRECGKDQGLLYGAQVEIYSFVSGPRRQGHVRARTQRSFARGGVLTR